MHATARPTNITPDVAAQVAADHLGLPTGRLIARDNTAHIFTDDIHDLRAWLNTLGGYTTRERAGLGVTLWTLRTQTEPRADGTTTPIHVHALALTDEHIHPDITESLA